MRVVTKCPVNGCLAELVVQDDPETSKVLGVLACSEIEGEVDCEQGCLHQINLKREKARQAREIDATPEEP